MGEKTVNRRQFLAASGLVGAGLVGAGLSGCTQATSNSTGTGSNDAAQTGSTVGAGKGRGGAIVVEMSVANGVIDAVTVLSESETQNVGSLVIESYPQMMVDNNTINVDIVTGATVTCMGFKEAATNALAAAGLNASDFDTLASFEEPANGDTSVDMVVIGSGGAGLAAATKTAMAGKKVILLEKLSVIGGTSNFTIEGYGSVGDLTHTAVGGGGTPDSMATAYTNAWPKGNQEAFLAFASNNGAQANWLRSIGAVLPVTGAPTSVVTSREVGEIGVTIVGALHAEAIKSGVDVRNNSEATEILMDGGKISGVVVKTSKGTEYTISCPTVVITCGGFAANLDMVAEQMPATKGLSFSCGKGSTGEMIKMAESLGAQLSNMDFIRINFTYSVHPETNVHYYTGSLFNTGAVFINQNGKRMINEQGGYGVGPTVLSDAEGTGWAIFDSQIIYGSEDVRKYRKIGLYTQADTLDELFDAIGVDKATANATVETYRQYVASGADPEFKRGMLNMTFDEPPFYACKQQCMVQGTFGGILTNVNAEVLDANGAPIPGLYAAGECAEEGTYGVNPASVNLVFGGFASENAVAYMG